MRGSMRLVASFCLGLTVAACSTTHEPPDPGEPQGRVPDLRGRSVLVLPVQMKERVPYDVTVDEEIAYALPARSDKVTWTLPAEMEKILSRSPGVEANLHGLPVGIFLQAEVNRIGDPLYGEIRRMTTLAGADFALIPVQLEYIAEGRYTLAGAIINAVTGRVSWFGIVQGGEGAADAPGTVASVVDAFAQILLPMG
jgi:hypothetical protein